MVGNNATYLFLTFQELQSYMGLFLLFLIKKNKESNSCFVSLHSVGQCLIPIETIGFKTSVI